MTKKRFVSIQNDTFESLYKWFLECDEKFSGLETYYENLDHTESPIVEKLHVAAAADRVLQQNMIRLLILIDKMESKENDTTTC